MSGRGAAHAVPGPADDGAVTPDGSPIEIYRHLPPAGEAELIAAAVPSGAEILELGSGVGRVTRRLVALGHPVVAVDESAQMLADLRDVAGVECVVSRIEELRLGRRFAVVLLGSHLVNTPEPQRGEILAAARRHAADGADLVAEVYPPGMRWTEAQASHAGPVEIHLEDVTRVGSRISATVVYGLRERSWRQRFQAEILDEPRLREVLAASGLRFERWLDESRGWLLARPARGEPLRAT